jgi:hypothetical protein
MPEPTPDREREALLEWLAAQRGHVLGVLSGLSEEDLWRPVLPSGWSCLALVRRRAVLAPRRRGGRAAAPRRRHRLAAVA